VIDFDGTETSDVDDTLDTDEDAAMVRRLFETLEAQAESDPRSLTVHEQRTAKGETRCNARSTSLSLRFKSVTIQPPTNDPRTKDAAPVQASAVLVRECDPPEGCEPLQWRLLTSEPVETVDDAWRIVRYYRHRWMIEEWHRALKEGCQVEAAQFDDAMDVQRLAAIKGIIAARLLQLRDLADQAGDDASRLQAMVPMLWILVVAALAKLPAETLTPKQFFHGIAKRGGWLGRKHDRRPGWKVLWRGWKDLHMLVEGAELMRPRCG